MKSLEAKNLNDRIKHLLDTVRQIITPLGSAETPVGRTHRHTRVHTHRTHLTDPCML